jgi:DNA polymerase-1
VGDSFRVNISDQYKAHRDQKPADFHELLKKTRDATPRPAVSNVSCEGYEADDCIASLTRMALDEGQRAVLFSADKDLHQLLSPGYVTQVTKVERLSADKLAMYVTTADALVEKYGVRADQWIDYRAIVGDPSDGIPGCPGLGKAAATEVLKQAQTLDAFYKNPFAARLSEKQRNALLNYKQHLPDVRKMLQLVDSLPLAEQFAAVS